MGAYAEFSHTIIITIGDFSCDGHNHFVEYYVRSNKSRDEVRDAWFEAAWFEAPECNPSKFCSRLEEKDIPDAILAKLRERGAPMPVDTKRVKPIEMLHLSMWFAMLGDPELRLEKIEAEPLLFCGGDRKGRYLDNIGFGCFDSDWTPDEGSSDEAANGR